MEKLKTAVVGVGRMGGHHARILSQSESCDLVAVVDASSSNARKVGRQYGCEAYKHYERLFEKTPVDAVVVAVPTSLHHEVTTAFLERGVHCMVEKPIASTVEEAEDLIRLSDEKNCILQIGHVEHYNAAVRKLKEILDRPGFIECHRLGPFSPRISDVGVVLDLMIHDIDIVLQMVDSPIRWMDAVGVNILTGNEDIANVRIKFENECTANLTVSRVSPKPQRKIRVFQRNSYVSMDCMPNKQSIEVYKFEPNAGAKPGEVQGEIVRKRYRPRKEDMLTLELKDFVDAIHGLRQPSVTGQNARDALHVAVEVARMVKEQNARVKFG